MTTTDPTSPHAQTHMDNHMDNVGMSLAEQIAREHYVTHLAGGASREQWFCKCGRVSSNGPDEGFVAAHVRHIATVTEQAVRERIEAEIDAFEPEDRALVHMPDWREAMEDAARIARGATP